MDGDLQYMRRALELAEQGRGRTSPNPMVGCVVVSEAGIVGEGYHRKAGEPHAEVNALEAAGDAAGATLYVTLEPCTLEGRTPPCVDLLIERRLARVVAAMPDPNPRVAGQGIARLREAGIEVEVGLLENEARRLNEVFCKYITTKTPFVIAKCGMSLDGKIATRTGHSRWVTSETSRRRVHELRNEVDAILVGSRTVMLDDPSLTTRLDAGKIKDPIRIVLDAGTYLDQTPRVFHSDSPAPTWVAVPEIGGRFPVFCSPSVENGKAENREASPYFGADEVLHVPSGPGGLDMRKLMLMLGEREVASVLIEGGGATLASAFEAGVVDKVMFFVAPKIVGGRDAITSVEGEGIERMEEAIQLTDMRAYPMGEDILIEAYVKKE